MKSDGEDGNGLGTPFENQHQGSQDRPFAGIPKVREREGDQGTPGIVPKRVAELHYIKNWRPTTLLNCNYIIAVKALTNQLKNVLPHLINNNQTSFMKIGS